MTAENFTKFMADLNSRIFTLVGSEVEHERLCGITIIGEILFLRKGVVEAYFL
jgi:hypothetical protein